MNRNVQRISVSSLSGFGAGCNRQWALDQMYIPLTLPGYFFIGRLVHEGLETYYRLRRSRATEFEIELAISSDLLARIATTQLKDMTKSGQTISDDEATELFQMADSMLFNYVRIFDILNPLVRPEDRVISTEFPIVQNIPGLPDLALSGRIDLVIKRENGDVWIVDHKVVGQKMSPGGLDVDEQVTAYCWLYWKKTGIVPKGVIYNVFVKSLPRDPVVLRSGALSKDKSQSTTYELYLRAIQSRGLDVDYYQDILAHLKDQGWSRYFDRLVSYRGLEELESFERRLLIKVPDLVSKRNLANAYPSPSGFSCGWCKYLGICKSMETGDDWETLLANEFIRVG